MDAHVSHLIVLCCGLILINFTQCHYNDVIMSAMASQITSLAIVCSIVYLGANQRKLQSSASLPFVRGIHRWPVNSPHKRQVTRKMLPFYDVIMATGYRNWPRYGLRWSGLCCHSRHSTSGPAVARPLAAGPRVLCREWQHKPRQRRPYEWSISILPRKRSKTQR